ncbi:MAG TPA: esterase-like activity of phytase family protein [Bryobacteraceae bacterium]|nr:esterase-like activity of phytase family protein [Bryobacteraceae bacterium]
MNKLTTRIALSVAAFGLAVLPGQAQPSLLAIGTLSQSRAGDNADLSGLTYKLENGAPANLLGGLGSGLAYASGNTFLALPDRGPNAVTFDNAIDSTVSYINRFHTVTMDLEPNTAGSGLPFTLTPTMRSTTLLWSLTPLVYGTGAGLGVGSGVPPVNNFLLHFFTGRSDNFNPNQNSGDPNDARFDSESIRVSNDGLSVFISDEYGPYVYQFSRFTGVRLRSYKLPDYFYVSNLKPVGADEISGNTSGRTANKGMEGLALTPDGRTLVGIMQNALLQDAALGGNAANLLRIVTVNVLTGQTHQYAYLLTNGSGVSDICAINNHEFLVDERDGKGLEGGDGATSNNAEVKQIFKIDLAGAVDISNMDGAAAANHAVKKTLFLDIVTALAGHVAADHIPSKIEGIAFGPDVKKGGTKLHTLWVSNDNDFLLSTSDVPSIANPNQFYVFGFTDADLMGSTLVPQFGGSSSQNQNSQGQDSHNQGSQNQNSQN